MPSLVLPERTLIGVSGTDAAHLLHNVLTCDVEGLSHGVAQPSALLTPQGKVLFDFLVARDGENFLIDIDKDQTDAFLKRMMLYKLRSKAEFTTLDQKVATVSWNGDLEASKTESAASSADLRPVLSDKRFTTTSVLRVIGPRTSEAGHTAPFEEWQRLRIENGVPESGTDFRLGDAFGHDISFDQNGGLDFKKGCFVGQEVVSRMQHRGTARRRVVIVTGETALPPTGTDISAGGKPAGALGTVVGDRALAIVRLDRVKTATDRGEAVLAGDVPVSISLPPNVTYGWPGDAPAEDPARA